jgi:4-amino-4-deoxy-L-arabinose transferase-like glycosyltransferase
MSTGSRQGGSSFLILLICAAALLATAAFAAFAFERLPHLEDEVAYLFQARTMAMGRLSVPSPAQPDSFWTPFVLDYRGQRFGKYTPGWPAMLALGARVHAAWLVNPLLAACALYLVYRLGRTLYDTRTGLLAAALGLFSPLFLVLGGSFLSHLASMVWLLLFSLWFIWAVRGRSPWFALGAGLALGTAFLVRPLTAAAWAAPFALYALVQLNRGKPSRPASLLVAAGAIAMAALLPLYQRAVTGDPLLNPYTLWWPYDRLGFGPGIGAMPGGHSLHYAWLNLRQDLTNAATDVLGWPMLSWLPLALGLALAPRRRRDWALLAPFACLVTAYLFYWIGSPSRLWGPRYYFEGFAGLWLLGAVGLVKAWDWAGARPRWLRMAGVAAVACLLAINLALLIPARWEEAHGFYGISRAQYRPILDADLHNALVIVYADRWLEYGALLGEMSPTLDGDVIYVRGSKPETDAAVIAQYPGRAVYYLAKGRLSTTHPAP